MVGRNFSLQWNLAEDIAHRKNTNWYWNANIILKNVNES